MSRRKQLVWESKPCVSFFSFFCAIRVMCVLYSSFEISFKMNLTNEPIFDKNSDNYSIVFEKKSFIHSFQFISPGLDFSCFELTFVSNLVCEYSMHRKFLNEIKES